MSEKIKLQDYQRYYTKKSTSETYNSLLLETDLRTLAIMSLLYRIEFCFELDQLYIQ